MPNTTPQADALERWNNLFESAKPFAQDDGDPNVPKRIRQHAQWVQQRIVEAQVSLACGQIDQAFLCAGDAQKHYEALRYLLSKEWWAVSEASQYYADIVNAGYLQRVTLKSASERISRACKDKEIESFKSGRKRFVNRESFEAWTLRAKEFIDGNLARADAKRIAKARGYLTDSNQ